MYSGSRFLLEDWAEPTVYLLMSVIASIWVTKRAIKYENIKKHMTKRINVKIIGKMGRGFYCCAYRFTGQGEYEGITFYDPWLEAWARHKVGETVSLLVNEYNLKEFWFEEAERISYRRTAIVAWVITFLVFAVYMAFLLSDLIPFGMIM